MSDLVYIAADANLIGRKIEKYILSEELEELSAFSRKLSETVNRIEESVLSMGGCVYMAAGDDVLARISWKNAEELVMSWKSMIPERLFTFSVGIGNTPAEAYLAIKYAKVSSRFAVLYKDDHFETFTESSGFGGSNHRHS